MRLSSSGRDTNSPIFMTRGSPRTASSQVTLNEGSLLVLAVVRLLSGLLWFQQLFWKLPPSFTGLHPYVLEEAKYTFLPGYAFIINHVFLPNFILLGAFTWLAELVVSLCLLFGVFSRFGGLLSAVLSLQLYVGLAYAPGEWYWTYGLLVLLGVVLATVPTGRRLGVDQLLVERFASSSSRVMRIVRWFV